MGRAIPHTSSRATVLDVIRAAGTISRAGLASATGLTAATISNVVRGLLADELVTEVGRAESTGGKPRVLLRLVPSSRYAVGVHLDAGGTTYALTDLTGAVVSRMAHVGTREEDPEEVPARMVRQVDALVDGAGVDRERLLGIGLVTAAGVPAPVSLSAQDLERATGLSVVTGDDATASALGEYWSGEAGGASVLAAVYMGATIGAGVLVDGIPYRGAHGNAGDLGHVCLDVDGPECRCGARGCLEAIAGPEAIVAAARADERTAGAAGLVGRERSSVVGGFTAVVRAARSGDPTARALVDRSARYTAVAVRTLVGIVDPDLVVLTGVGQAVAGETYLPAVRRELGTAFAGRGGGPVRVRLSTFADTAPAIGAAAMVLRSRLTPLRTPGLRLPDDLSESGPVPVH
ncbi:ROK family transcriptional regulator [Nocardiopsis lambiniae]|uniref:ROK family transcriptional regulator n=1 Tax=Nocardiopsis lambiniae TaxID=3075539 RepID=A0ABU2MAQ4_9ACTN|nr:ROK family transcriptional regulator [Nocardiopsis sp. DSM 44743]MDT0329759.1 ROK family transcriptional regulator [Nocardiopsis sp. DSM 44743]